jgi:uncharacterized protein YggE
MAVLAVALMALTPRTGRAAEVKANDTTLTVTEEEPVAAPTEGATLYLGIETHAQDSRSAQSDAQAALERLRQGLRSAGVPTTDVKVQGYRIGALQRSQQGDGYVVVQNVVARIAKAGQLGAAIDAAVASGATMVQGTADQYQAPSASERASAVAAAVRAARGDAQAIASALQEQLGRPQVVSVHMRRLTTPGPSYAMLVQVTFAR